MTEALATAGRHATNDLVLADPSVSGAHLELGAEGGLGEDPRRGIDERDVARPASHRRRRAGARRGDHRREDDASLRRRRRGASRRSEPARFVRWARRTLGRDARAVRDPRPRRRDGGSSVVIHGETGTGKEEVARAIHAASKRKEHPLVVIDATSLPESLAESLLFGHEKGAFTGATERRAGFFEAAEGGTVFIDEVGELTGALQAKFLRVLERHEIVRVGGHQPVKVDVRIVAATHRDLRNEIDGRRFRDDLYFRLAQIRVRLPPLRDRLEDLGILCEKLLTGIANGDERIVSVDAEALDHLKTLSWPGNVRELRNVLARAAALMSGDIVRRSDVAGEGDGFRGSREERTALDVGGLFADAKQRSIERFESAYLAALMRRTEGNLSRASRESGVVRHHLRELLRKRGLYHEGEPVEAESGTRH